MGGILWENNCNLYIARNYVFTAFRTMRHSWHCDDQFRRKIIAGDICWSVVIRL